MERKPWASQASDGARDAKHDAFRERQEMPDLEIECRTDRAGLSPIERSADLAGGVRPVYYTTVLFVSSASRVSSLAPLVLRSSDIPSVYALVCQETQTEASRQISQKKANTRAPAAEQSPWTHAGGAARQVVRTRGTALTANGRENALHVSPSEPDDTCRNVAS